MAPTPPFNPMILVSNQSIGQPARFFPVTKNDANNNVDNGNIMGCWLLNNDTQARAAVIEDEYGARRTLNFSARSTRPMLFRRLRSTGTGGANWFAGIPYLNRRPPRDGVEVTAPAPVPELDASAADTHAITLSEVFGSFWSLGYTAVSSTVATATVAIASGVLTITAVAAGTTNVTIVSDWFAGRDSIVLPVTVVA